MASLKAVRVVQIWGFRSLGISFGVTGLLVSFLVSHEILVTGLGFWGGFGCESRVA